LFHRKANQKAPVIEWNKQEDSVAERVLEMSVIHDSLQNGKWDSAGENTGRVYYSILKEGSGGEVHASDTVTVHYKGWVLNSHTIFDETKEAPITFPLKRLIRGWQLVIPKCKIGGTVRMILPSAMAYGIRDRAYKIPPNAILVFDVEVVAAKQ
jgi:FKBP-type peptidyl-prolyl cis-trans isomerase